MSFIRITNAGTLERVYLETVGLSTKRDRRESEEVVGLFGSGFKFAVVAGLRLGVATAVASSDAGGDYFVRIGAEPIPQIPGRQRLVYRYYGCQKDGRVSRTHDYKSSLALDACLGWDAPIGDDDATHLKLFKEHVCNARDEDKRFRIEECEAEQFASEGTTQVYLSDTPEIRRMLARPERWFKFLSKSPALRRHPGLGEIWPKSERRKTRHYVLGVLVDCTLDPDRRSLFDYSSSNKLLLSDERVLRDQYGFAGDVGEMLARETEVPFCTQVMSAIAAGVAPFEEMALGRVRAEWLTPESSDAWLAAVRAVHGEKPCLGVGDAHFDNDAEQVYGFAVIYQARDSFRQFLQLLGVPSSRAVQPNLLESVVDVPFRELDGNSQARFLEAFDRFSRRWPERAGIPISIGRPLTQAAAQHGFALNFERILVLTTLDGELPGADSLFSTLQHESCHCASRAGDSDRRFRMLADEDLLDDALMRDGVPIRDDGRAVPTMATEGCEPNLVPFAATPPLLSPQEQFEFDLAFEHEVTPTIPPLPSTPPLPRRPR